MINEITIFYADDDVDDLEFFRDVTNAMDRKIRLYTHDRGEKLLLAVFNPPPSPSIVFLDLNMPGKDGFEVLKEIKSRAQFRDIPVVIFSTSGDPRNIERARTLGANFYITKPDSYQELEKLIDFTLNIDWSSFRPVAGDFVYRKTA